MSAYVYIITNKKDGTLYIGVTSNLQKRVWEHKEKIMSGFSKKYNLDRLVYFEVLDDVENAIHREKRLKKYKREAKIKLIEKENSQWADLYENICA
ncbi:MAG: endonuclease [Micavibrio sp.]|nr:endonuclease [Micavibrio sp.]